MSKQCSDIQIKVSILIHDVPPPKAQSKASMVCQSSMASFTVYGPLLILPAFLRDISSALFLAATCACLKSRTSIPLACL